MEFKLNIYEKGKIAKTYNATQYDIIFGTVEDFLRIVDIDSFADHKEVSDIDFIKMVTQMITSGMGEIKGIFLEVFEGLTEEDLRHAKVREMVAVLLDLLKYSMAEMLTMASTEKN